RDLLLLGRERDLGNKLRRRFDRKLGKLVDTELPQLAIPNGLEGSRCGSFKLTSAGSFGRSRTAVFARDDSRHCHRQNFRPQTRAAATFAWLADHKRADPITGEFAFGFLVESLHLWHQTLKRLGDLFTVTAELNFNRSLARSKIK